MPGPAFESRPADWLTLVEARGRVLAGVEPLPAETVSLQDALGRALAAPVTARATLPPWDNSAMDGYALRGDEVEGASPDGPVELRVTGEIRAGDEPGPGVGPGEAVRIMTGAPLPPGTDSVVRVEDTDREAGAEGRVRVLSDRDRGRNVRPAGEDVREGERVLEAGTAVGPGQIALLAAVGAEGVLVHGRPRVAVLTNGDELVGPDAYDRVRAGRAIPDTNGPALAAALREVGAEPLLLGPARDTEESVREHLKRAEDAHLLVTVGGASMGAGDLFKRVLDTLGFELDFWRVRIRPGSPVSFGRLPRESGPPLPVFGLPGNPSSAFVTFQLLVRPRILALAGHRRCFRPRIRARARDELRGKDDLTHFFRVSLERSGQAWEASLAGPQGSGLVSPLGRADGLAVLPRGVARIPSGEPVEVVLLRDGPGWPEPAGD